MEQGSPKRRRRLRLKASGRGHYVVVSEATPQKPQFQGRFVISDLSSHGACIDSLPHRDANSAVYLWLAALSAFADPPTPEEDALHADIRALQSAQRMTRAALTECPGLRRVYANLTSVTRQLRRPRSLPVLPFASREEVA